MNYTQCDGIGCKSTTSTPPGNSWQRININVDYQPDGRTYTYDLCPICARRLNIPVDAPNQHKPTKDHLLRIVEDFILETFIRKLDKRDTGEPEMKDEELRAIRSKARGVFNNRAQIDVIDFLCEMLEQHNEEIESHNLRIESLRAACESRFEAIEQKENQK